MIYLRKQFLFLFGIIALNLACILKPTLATYGIIIDQSIFAQGTSSLRVSVFNIQSAP